MPQALTPVEVRAIIVADRDRRPVTYLAKDDVLAVLDGFAGQLREGGERYELAASSVGRAADRLRTIKAVP